MPDPLCGVIESAVGHPPGFGMVGLPDGSYEWTNGDNICNIVKSGSKVILEGSDTLAGT